MLDLFIDENFVKYREMQMGSGGLLKGQELASTFSFLRPNDLVWNYVVGNYLKGETPPPFDLLYWNSDSTNLPGPMYAWYLRNTYLENNLVKPGKVTVCGEKVDLRKRRHAGLHLRLARGPHRADRRRLRLGQAPAGQEALRDGRLGPHRRRDQPAGEEEALVLDQRQAARQPCRVAAAAPRSTRAAGGPTGPTGSSRTRGKQIPAPKRYGKGATYKAIEPAPGRYVKAKA